MRKKFFKNIFLLSSFFIILIFLSGCTFKQYIAHYANSYGWKTKLTLKNSNDGDVNITMNFYDNDGNKVSTTDLTLPAYGFRTDYVENFFPDSLPDTGSIEIISDEPGYTSKVSSIILFEHDNNGSETCMAGLQGAQIPAKYLTFPWFENSSNFTTGIAILNVSGYDIVATMRAFTEDGNVIYSKPIRLKPMQRILGFASDFFNDQIPDMSTLDVYATGKIAGFIIMYNNSVTKAEAINGVESESLDTQIISYRDHENGKSFPVTDSFLKMSKDFNKFYVLVKNKGLYEIDKSDIYSGNLIFSPSSNIYGKFDISPDGKNIVIADNSSGSIYEFNLKDHSSRVIDTLDGVWSVAFSNDGNYFAAGTDNGKIVLYSYDVTNDSFTQIHNFLESGGNIYDITFSPDSRYVVAVDYGLRKIYYADLTSSNFHVDEKDINIDGMCDIKVTDSGEYYICGNSGDICYLSDLSSDPSYISTSANKISSIALSPDGRFLFASSGDSSDIHIIDLLNNNNEEVINCGTRVNDLFFSPEDFILYYTGGKLGYLH